MSASTESTIGHASGKREGALDWGAALLGAG